MFRSRSDAFDFNATLEDFKQKSIFESNLKKEEFKPKYDFSLQKNSEIKTENKPNNLSK